MVWLRVVVMDLDLAAAPASGNGPFTGIFLANLLLPRFASISLGKDWEKNAITVWDAHWNSRRIYREIERGLVAPARRLGNRRRVRRLNAGRVTQTIQSGL